MTSKLGLILCLCGALTLALACSDDDGKDGQKDTGSVTLDTGTGGDSFVDGGVTGDSTVDTGTITQDTGGPATSNSGAICNQQNPTCPGGEDEICVILAGTATNGMCAGKCGSQAADCPVVGANMVSKCFGQVEVQPGQIQLVCLYICEAQGQTYNCPDATNFNCEALDPNQPSIKICVPK